jgi:transposase
MNARPSYSTDVTDAEWELIKPYVPEAKPGGRPEVYPKREILNGIFDLLRPAVPGACYPMTCHRGVSSITTFGSGAKTAPGR